MDVRILPAPYPRNGGFIMTEAESLEYCMAQVMMALGIIADLSDWYACGDELI
jgi:hypothetical protein